MADSLPSFTRTIDDDFVTTWYEIREEAIDNILGATVTWAALVGAGCLTPQTGSEIITRTIRYGTVSAENVTEGHVMTPGDPDLETMAIWYWKYIAVNIQRSMIKDQQNAGPSKIKSYVGNRITAARDALEQQLESDIWSAHDSTEANATIQGLNDLVPSYYSGYYDGGTYGGITRANTWAAESNGVYKPSGGTNPWWGNNYYDGTDASVEDDLLDDMKKLYNSIHANQSPPNLLICTQDLFEIYETFAVDISQIIKDESNRLADLGFEVLRFKGKPLIWSKDCTPENGTGFMLMLNTDFIELVYDPMLWFDMTDWKPITYEFDRAAQIILCANLITTQPRRHGRLEYED